jgi:aspartyl-tRNA(Asn)/glutamyl-tRNA(Gln) amidotransferase subunit C
MSEGLDENEVRKIARLARLALSDEEVRRFANQLTRVLTYVNRLAPDHESEIDSPETQTRDPLAEDQPGVMMNNAELMRIAPMTDPPFLRVPKVIDDGGSS